MLTSVPTCTEDQKNYVETCKDISGKLQLIIHQALVDFKGQHQPLINKSHVRHILPKIICFICVKFYKALFGITCICQWLNLYSFVSILVEAVFRILRILESPQLFGYTMPFVADSYHLLLCEQPTFIRVNLTSSTSEKC